MSARTDTPLIMMVAQTPFETADLNQFCKLIPIVYSDGVRPERRDFPNEGEVWWMLNPYTAHFAEPGQLIVGAIEFAARYEERDPASSKYQVVRDSIQFVTAGVGFEVINVSGDLIDDIENVVSPGFYLELEIPPTSAIILHWRSHFYGPFTARVQSGSHNAQRYWLSPAHTDGLTIYRIEEKQFGEATKAHRIIIDESVSRTNERRQESYDTIHVRHELLLGPGYERLLAGNPTRLTVESLERKLQRFAKNCLTRAKRQQLKALLEELELTAGETGNEQDLVQAVARVKNITESQDNALNSLAQALLKSGLLGEDRIAKAEGFFANKYIEQRTAELQATVEQGLATARALLRETEEQLKKEQANLLKLRAEQQVLLARELAEEKQKALKQLEAEKEDFTKQKAELQRQQDLLQTNLQKVTKDLREAGDEVVNRFLTIAPLLGVLNPMNKGRQPEHVSQSQATPPTPSPKPTFKFPAFISAPPSNSTEIKEDVFFDRFRKVVENSGFTFRPLDLQRFHLSVKTGDLTILAGPSGTGKSSLPALYSQALLGDDSLHERTGCLMVNVNPSWMDTRDLLGHLNSLDGRFYPAESGLYQHLLYAQQEHASRAAATGVYLTCLDEMNLSQVEHYFSDLMMVLERTGSARKVKCFSAEAAAEECPFREWGELALSPALRFVGTVNFDETTRLLSDRFLDRVNLIRLNSAGLPALATARSKVGVVHGPTITLADFDAWCSESALPTELGTLLDQMRPILAQMGCPISARVYRGMCRFVASAPPILSPEKAFEVQVAQRIIPRVRTLVTNRQIQALDLLLKLLSQSTVCTFEECLLLLEEVRDAVSAGKYELEP